MAALAEAPADAPTGQFSVDRRVPGAGLGRYNARRAGSARHRGHSGREATVSVSSD